MVKVAKCCQPTLNRRPHYPPCIVIITQKQKITQGCCHSLTVNTLPIILQPWVHRKNEIMAMSAVTLKMGVGRQPTQGIPFCSDAILNEKIRGQGVQCLWDQFGMRASACTLPLSILGRNPKVLYPESRNLSHFAQRHKKFLTIMWLTRKSQKSSKRNQNYS